MSNLLSTVLSVLAVGGALFALAQSRKQRDRDFENLFVQRYWAIMEQLSLPALEGTQPPGATVSDHDRRLALAYIRLCEDELDLRAAGWVRADTWRLWHEAIAAQLRRWPFSTVWQEVAAREAARREDGQFGHLRAAGDELFDPGYDPKRCTLRRSRTRPSASTSTPRPNHQTLDPDV